MAHMPRGTGRTNIQLSVTIGIVTDNGMLSAILFVEGGLI
jgi:hypothetical protein